MTLEQIMKMWNEDCQVDPNDLAGESIKATKLHSKYMNLMMENRIKARSLDKKYREKKLWKIRYYRGDFNNPEDISKYNLDGPFQQLILNNDLNTWLDADEELNNLLLKRVYHEEISEYCKLVIKELESRSYKLGNAIKWRIFTGGGS